MRGSFNFNKEELRMKVNTKDFFSQLDEETVKKASKKEKEEKKKKSKKDPFGYDFDPKDFDKKKKKKKSKDKDKDSKSKKDKKKSNEKKPEKDVKNDGKVAKKILSGIKSPALREQFKQQQVLIDNKKFWTKD